jgi:uncharacterized protein (DUF1499 family)
MRTIGLTNGQLQPCPDTPNCVSTQAQASDSEHYMQALTYSGDAATAKTKIISAMTAMPRAKIISQDDNYIHAEFRSRLFRFVDDVEFLLNDTAKTIDFRSASRLGRSDMGVNRKRMTELSQVLEASLK